MSELSKNMIIGVIDINGRECFDLSSLQDNYRNFKTHSRMGTKYKRVVIVNLKELVNIERAPVTIKNLKTLDGIKNWKC
jgi:hypothetical protein